MTGGGAHKYAQIIEKELGVIVKCEEIPYLVKGMAFITNHCVNSSFSRAINNISNCIKTNQNSFENRLVIHSQFFKYFI